MSMKSAPCVHGVSRVTAVLTSAAHEQTRGVRSAPSFPDSGFVANSRCGLLFQILVVDLLRRPVLNSGVPTPRIVPEFDVPHNVAARMLAGRILGTVDTLVLQRGEERLRHGIVVTYPGAADGL